MKNKDVVRNIEPYHAELKNLGDGGFEIWFYSNIGNDYSRNYINKIKFKSYWLKFLARMLWQVQAKSQEKADMEAKALRGGSWK